MKTILLIIFYLQLFSVLLAQKEFNTTEQIIAYSDRLYGNDDKLVNGKLYIPQSIRSEGHPYFVSNKFKNATVYIGNTIFNNVLLRYNIQNDEFILHRILKSAEPAFMVLNNSVDSVLYMQHVFVPANKLNINGTDGYYEKIKAKNFIFLIKYYKTSREVYYRTMKYSGAYRDYFVSVDGKLIKVNSKKAFVNVFSENKKDIVKYFKKYKVNYKSCDFSELTGLIMFCDDLQNK